MNWWAFWGYAGQIKTANRIGRYYLPLAVAA